MHTHFYPTLNATIHKPHPDPRIRVRHHIPPIHHRRVRTTPSPTRGEAPGTPCARQRTVRDEGILAHLRELDEAAGDWERYRSITLEDV